MRVNAGHNINGGVFYTERGDNTLRAGQDVDSNGTRNLSDAPPDAPRLPGAITSPNFLPTTVFLGKGRVDVVAGRNLWLGPVANAFLSYQGYNNRTYDVT